MLTAKENMIETLKKDGHPDRYVNEYEAITLLPNPFTLSTPPVIKGADAPVANQWGVYMSFPSNVPGPYPVQDDQHLVVKDFEHWRDYVTPPSLDFSDEAWGECKRRYDAVDGKKALKTAMVAPGLFEQCHHMSKIEVVLMAMYEYPDELHDMIRMLTEWELKLAEGICSHLHPEALFHHDDWGSQKTTFMSVDMFEEFFVGPYKQIYGYYHDHGVKYVIHHSDSYAATFVPDMIEMGIDCWQGCFSTNNVPEMLRKYGDKISFMGGIENCLVDFEGWSDENTRQVVRRTIEECGMHSYIPCIAQGGPGSVFPGVYESIWKEIDAYNTEKFGFTKEQLDEQRMPPQSEAHLFDS